MEKRRTKIKNIPPTGSEGSTYEQKSHYHRRPRYPGILADQKIREILSVASLIITICLISYFISMSASPFIRFVFSVVVLGIDGAVLKYLLGLEGSLGMIIVRLSGGREVIAWIKNRLGKHWNTIADMGLVLAFGVSSKFAFRHISNRTFVMGLLFFLAFAFVILPNSASITFSLIQIPLESIQAASGDIRLSIIAMVVVLLFGVVGFAMLGILASAAAILAAMISFVMGNTAALAAAAPGIYPVLPYFTIPLFEGLIALVVLMVVHEGSHGIAAMIARIRVKSTGLITFGFIPVGAFVDIDEKQLDETRDVDNARVSVAGSAANLFTALVFFIPTALLMASLPIFQQDILTVTATVKNISFEGAPITVGTNITAVNGIPVSNAAQYLVVLGNTTPNSTLVLMTDQGESRTQLIGDVPGFVVAQPMKPEFLWIKPVFATLGLLTILNLLIGIINLLPIPSFDGHRLFKIIFKKKWVVDTFAAIIVIAFLMNIIPWVWQ
ncbi:MAG: site-2 protease family protein [Candidatus Micrarchaeia archaeon]